MYQNAAASKDEDEDESGMNELVESVGIVLTATLGRSTRRPDHVRLVKNSHEGWQYNFSRPNQELPITEEVSTTRRTDEEIECRRCSGLFKLHFHDEHLETGRKPKLSPGVCL